MEVEDRPMTTAATRDTTHREKSINKKVIKKINNKILGIFKQILYFKTVLKPLTRFYFF